jgi:hypothetical protein
MLQSPVGASLSLYTCSNRILFFAAILFALLENCSNATIPCTDFIIFAALVMTKLLLSGQHPR